MDYAQSEEILILQSEQILIMCDTTLTIVFCCMKACKLFHIINIVTNLTANSNKRSLLMKQEVTYWHYVRNGYTSVY